jgi:hypothetical protein
MGVRGYGVVTDETRFHFCLANRAPSAQVRGVQMAGALGGTYGVNEACTADVTVFVKGLPLPWVYEAAKSRSAVLAFDPIDNYDFKGMGGYEFDVVLACTEAHADRLREVFPSSLVRKVPHHHLPLIRRGGGDRVGYIGDIENLGVSPREIARRYPGAVVDRDLKQYANIGVGISYRPPGQGREYKSSIKMANYWASGVAVVCDRGRSHVEEGVDGEDVLMCDGEEELFENIDRLRRDEGLRESMVRSGLVRARGYGIGAVAGLYGDVFRSYSCGTTAS